MAGGTYTIFLTVDAAGAVTGLRTVQGELGAIGAKAKETGTILGGMFKFLAIGAVAHELFEAGEAFLKVKSDIQVAGLAGDKFSESFDKLLSIANETRQPIEQMSELFRQLAIYSSDLGIKQEQLFSITKTFNEALTLGGASAQRASNGTIQFAHAIEQAKVQGQQFNALMKDNPIFLRAVAEALHTNISGLKEMQLQGKLTGQELVKGAIGAEKFVDAIFKLTVPTIGQALVVFRNNLVGAIKDMDQATGAMSFFAAAILRVAQSFRTIAPFVVNFALALGTARLAMALWTTTATAGALASALFGKSVVDASGKLIVARAAFGGILTAIALVVTAMFQFGDKVKFTIGPVKNLHDLAIVLAGAFQYLLQAVLRMPTALVLLGGALLTLRLRLGAVGLAITAVAAVLTYFRPAVSTVLIALVALGAGALALGLRLNNLKTIAAGLVFGISALVQAFRALAAAETLAELPLLAWVIAAAGAVVAGALIVKMFYDVAVAIYKVIQAIPGLEPLVAIIDKLVSYAYDKIASGLEAASDAAGKLGEKVANAADRMLDTAKAAAAADEETEKAAAAAAKLADNAAAAAKNMQSAASAASKAGGGGGSATATSTVTNTTTINLNASNGSVATVSGDGNTASYSGGGGGDGGSGKGGGGDSGGGAQKGSFKVGPDYVYGVAPNPSGQGGYHQTKGAANGIGPAGGMDVDAFAQEQGNQLLARMQLIYEAMAEQNKISSPMALDTNTIKLLALKTGQTTEDVRLTMKNIAMDQGEAFKVQKQIYNIEQKIAQQQAEAQAEEQRKAAMQQARDSSISQLTLQALNAFQVGTNAELPGEVRNLISQISAMQGQLAVMTNPIQQAEMGRRIQILTDQLGKLTNAVTAATDENWYTKFAQNVYGTAIGIANAKSAGIANGPAGANVNGAGGSLYMGSFASGGNIKIQSDGMYSANLHAGEKVRISREDSNDRPVVLNMVVNGVKDTAGFHRSKKQILTTMYRGLMAAGAQS